MTLQELFLTIILPLLGSLVSALIGYSLLRLRRKQVEQKKTEVPQSAQDRLKQLEATASSLKNILGFVENLKLEIVEKEHVLAELKKQHQEAKKAAELDKEVLDIVQKSLSGVLSKENRKQARLNFFFGLVTGLIAGAVFFILQMVLR